MNEEERAAWADVKAALRGVLYLLLGQLILLCCIIIALAVSR